MRQAHDRTYGVVHGLLSAAFTAACAIAVTSGAQAAEAEQCATGCRAKHNQCRIQMKGAPSCDTQLEACLRSCVAAQTKAAPIPAPKK